MSPCCAYAVALDAEKTMTSPMPMSAATAVKRTGSRGAGAYAGGRGAASRCARSVAALCTGGLAQSLDRGRKPVATILRRREHVERRAAGGEQYDAAGHG